MASVKAEKLTDIPANSIDGLLQGRVAGVQVVNSSQDPGASVDGPHPRQLVAQRFRMPAGGHRRIPWGDAGDLKQINPQDIVSDGGAQGCLGIGHLRIAREPTA